MTELDEWELGQIAQLLREKLETLNEYKNSVPYSHLLRANQTETFALNLLLEKVDKMIKERGE